MKYLSIILLSILLLISISNGLTITECEDVQLINRVGEGEILPIESELSIANYKC